MKLKNSELIIGLNNALININTAPRTMAEIPIAAGSAYNTSSPANQPQAH